jgi:hypothetical protein
VSIPETPQTSTSQHALEEIQKNEVQSLSSSITLGGQRTVTRESSPIEIGPLVSALDGRFKPKSGAKAKMVLDFVEPPILPLSQKRLYTRLPSSRSAVVPGKGKPLSKRKHSAQSVADNGDVIDLTSPEPMSQIFNLPTPTSNLSPGSTTSADVGKGKTIHADSSPQSQTMHTEEKLDLYLSPSSRLDSAKGMEGVQLSSQLRAASELVSESSTHLATITVHKVHATELPSEVPSTSQGSKRISKLPTPPLRRPRPPPQSSASARASTTPAGTRNSSLQPLEKLWPSLVRSQTPASTRLSVMPWDTKQLESPSVEAETGSSSSNVVLGLYQPQYISKSSLAVITRHVLDCPSHSSQSSEILAALIDDISADEDPEDIPEAWMYFPQLTIQESRSSSITPEMDLLEESIDLLTSTTEKPMSVVSLEATPAVDEDRNHALPNPLHLTPAVLEQSFLGYVGLEGPEDWLVNENSSSINLPNDMSKDTSQSDLTPTRITHVTDEIPSLFTSFDTEAPSGTLPPISNLEDTSGSFSTLINNWDSHSTSTHLQGGVSIGTEPQSPGTSFDPEAQAMTTVNPSLLGGTNNITLSDPLTTSTPPVEPTLRSPSPSSSLSSASSSPSLPAPSRFLPQPEPSLSQRRSPRQRKASYKMSYAVSSSSSSPASDDEPQHQVHMPSLPTRKPPSAEGSLSNANAGPSHYRRWKKIERSNIDGEATLCHQCRRRTIYPKMKCSRMKQNVLCTKYFCIKCMER